MALPLGDLPDGLRADAQATDDIVVEDQHPAAGDRPHGHLLVAGDAEPAYQDHVGRDAEAGGDLIRHRHPAAGQPEDDDVTATPVAVQEPAQDPTGLPSIADQTVRHTAPPHGEPVDLGTSVGRQPTTGGRLIAR